MYKIHPIFVVICPVPTRLIKMAAPTILPIVYVAIKFAKLATFTVAMFFFTRHGDENGRKMERCIF